MELLGLSVEQGTKRFGAQSLLNRQGRPGGVSDGIKIITVGGGATL
jgi:hypothetical protein